MNFIFIYISLFILLFLAAFFAKRRFGLLGLALAAGSILSGMIDYDVGLIAGVFGMPSGPLTSAIVTSFIVLIPSVILLFHGYTYKSLIGKVVGAVLFAVLATVFLMEPLGHVLVPQGFGADIFNAIFENRRVIIIFGLTAAIVDLFFTKPASSDNKKSKH